MHLLKIALTLSPLHTKKRQRQPRRWSQAPASQPAVGRIPPGRLDTGPTSRPPSPTAQGKAEYARLTLKCWLVWFIHFVFSFPIGVKLPVCVGCEAYALPRRRSRRQASRHARTRHSWPGGLLGSKRSISSTQICPARKRSHCSQYTLHPSHVHRRSRKHSASLGGLTSNKQSSSVLRPP